MNKPKRIKVRFHLGRGIHYMKWKIVHPSGGIEHYYPNEAQLVMKGCTLKNSKSTALKIFEGDEKVVCAWILCDELQVKFGDFEPENKNRLKYNPRVLPFWNLDGKDVDGDKFKEIYSVDYGLYIKSK